MYYAPPRAASGGIDLLRRTILTLALLTLAQWNGAHILRVHDVAAAVQAARVTDALRACRHTEE